MRIYKRFFSCASESTDRKVLLMKTADCIDAITIHGQHVIDMLLHGCQMPGRRQ